MRPVPVKGFVFWMLQSEAYALNGAGRTFPDDMKNAFCDEDFTFLNTLWPVC